MLKDAEIQRKKDKEEERLRQEQEDNQRRSIDALNIEVKRASRIEQESIQHQAFMSERQKQIDREVMERNDSIRVEDEKRQKLIEDDVTRHKKLDYQAQL